MPWARLSARFPVLVSSSDNSKGRLCVGAQTALLLSAPARIGSGQVDAMSRAAPAPDTDPEYPT
jgi:hypothetical protein